MKTSIFSDSNIIIMVMILILNIYGWFSLYKGKNDKKSIEIIQPEGELEPIIDKSKFPYSREIIKKLQGREFEEFCKKLFEETGQYKLIELTDEKYDGGKDIILDNKIYVECKRYTDKATYEKYMVFDKK